ncbi:MAG: UDP-N-acetylglucosamine 4,6-dehydratase (inverting) [Desulfobacterales bacterium]|uniref:UDP-N-acetylglucosamine 4,6-dehydratase (Inverting) n=1 Tax=Candidatus Desulfatibia vada TaxID=2841696 RepID=A0A8J6P767_9BACT|nr:UDP-N-acetylglucosamine 4,6-dehydratase (inverting) [Candidatus Desulfatibia vada]
MTYRIQKVSDKLEVPRSTIRYWEKEFPQLVNPKRTNGGQRRYSEQDIGNLHKIKNLLHHKNKTIDEARIVLKQGNAGIGKIDWQNQSILLTGGTGSFGKHFCKIMIEKYHPKVIRIYSRDELKQHEMRQTFGEEYIRYFIGDVRDADRLRRAVEGVDIVIHAAALKQVPACEYNPLEAVKTNIHGAQNIIDAAIDTGVKKVMALSTDKAVNPVNLYGATKLCAEKIIVQGNSYSGPRGTKFSCVRYGNVLGSRGSVIPVFNEQKKTGKITITDKRMTRFWLTLDQAVELVLDGLNYMQGGETFVPKIPSMKVMDLAKAVAPECEIEIIGIRPGEKLHEVLITEEEGRNTVVYNGMYVILPNYSWWERQNYKTGKGLPDGFKYTSNNNDEWLTVDDLRKIIYGFDQLENDANKLATTIHQLNEKIILNMLNAEELIPETGHQEFAN